MGGDWYNQTTLVCRGSVTTCKDSDLDYKPDNLFFKLAKFKKEAPGRWTGVVDYDDDEPDEWLVVNVDEELVRHELDVPGPYEIQEEWRKVAITVKDDFVVVTSTSGV